jgi:hypothetical protein
MVESALHMPTTLSTDAGASQDGPSTIEHASSSPEAGPLEGPDSCADSFKIGSFDLVRQFVEQVVAKNVSAALGNGRSSRLNIDWAVVEAAVADSSSHERAIGRAVVIADQMCRGVVDDTHLGDLASSLNPEELFFAFSIADVVPDFGDESRYRTKMARRMARIFGGGRMTVAMTEG